MTQKSEIFEINYKNYLAQILDTDFMSIKEKLGTEVDGDQMIIPFLNRNYLVSKEGIVDESGKRPDYTICVILSKYILLCPDLPHYDTEWAAFRDFKKTSHFTNVNFYASDTERPIVQNFSGKLDTLSKACKKSGGFLNDSAISYDLVMQFNALPKISLLLLFNDKDEDFSAECSVLFQKHAEYYLDPESLAMTSAFLAKNIIDSVDKIDNEI